MCNEDFNALKQQLKALLDDSKRNIKELSDKDAPMYSFGEEIDYNFPCTNLDILEPINFFLRESIPNLTSKKEYISVYEKYVEFLADSCYSRDTLYPIYYRSEKHLQRLCKEIIEDINIDAEGNEDKEHFKDKKEYDEIAKNSRVRSYSAEVKRQKKATERSFGKWQDFTKELKRLMEANPTLPVVFLPPPSASIYADDLHCRVSYVLLVGEFREKIITVSYDKKEIDVDDLQNDEDIPF